MNGYELGEFVSDTQIEALNRPTASAVGLPGAAYTEAGFWELERQDYFPSRWMACAHECDLTAPGDAMPVSIAGFDLLLTRDSDGAIRAFHNVCAHRGMRVLDTRQSGLSSLRCPWHCWTYDLCGHLVATPNLGGIHVGDVAEFDRSKLGLREVRCDSFLNFVFVNLDDTAPALEQFLSPLKERLADYDLDALQPSGQSTSLYFEGNWKLVIEGGIEDYHVPCIHPQLGTHAGTFVPEWDETGCYVGFSSRRPLRSKGGATKTAAGNPREAGAGLPEFPHLAANPPGDGLAHEGAIFMVPPSAVFAVMPDHVATTLLVPCSVDRTEQRRTFLFVGEAAVSDSFAAAREAVCRGWMSVGEQDVDLSRALQHQHSQRNEIQMPTRFSPHWEPAVHHFQKMVVDHLLSRRANVGEEGREST